MSGRRKQWRSAAAWGVVGLGVLTLACPLRRSPSRVVARQIASEPAEEWEAVVDRALQVRWQADPGRASALGVPGYDARLPPYQSAALRRTVDRLTRTLRELYAFPPEALSRPEQIDRQLLIADLNLRIQVLVVEGRPLYTPLGPVEEAIESLLALYFDDSRPLDGRLAVIGDRLLRLPEFLTAVRENLHRPARIPCGAAVERARELRGFIDGELRTLADRLDQGGRERLGVAIDEACHGIDSFTDRLEPRCDAGPEIVPIGAANYSRRLLYDHGVRMEASEVAALAQTWLRRTSDPGPPRPSPRPTPSLETRDRREILDEIVPQVRALRALVAERGLATLPPSETPLRVAIPPGVMAQSSSPISLWPSPVFRRGSGLLLINLRGSHSGAGSAFASVDGVLDSATTLCAAGESFPGSQLVQLAAQRQASPVRRATTAATLLDGWGLYARQLAVEHGVVADDAHARQALLEGTRAAAARAWVDASLHTGKLSFTEAVTFLAARGGTAAAQRTVLGMLREPARAPAALLGYLAIIELRDRTQARRGAAFDLRRFHDTLLAQGAIPPAYTSSLFLGDPLPEMSSPSSPRQ